VEGSGRKVAIESRGNDKMKKYIYMIENKDSFRLV